MENRDRLIEALREIVSPILYMQRRVPPGYQFDGACANSLVTVEYLQEIARTALQVERAETSK